MAARNALEAKKYCPAIIFLDVSQAFDKVWIDGLIYKISQYLPVHYVDILSSYLYNRQFLVNYGNAYSAIELIRAGVPQGSVLGPILYVLYTADIPTTNSTTTAIFADDTVVLAPHEDYDTASTNLQKEVNNIFKWTQKWKIRLKGSKSARVDFALSPHHSTITTLNGGDICTKPHAKYLGIHLDSRLTWRKHITAKREEIKIRFRNQFWLLRARNKLSLENKRLVYITVIRPVWTYAAPIWDCSAISNLQILQRVQNNILRKISGAPWFVRNDSLHTDLKIETMKQLIGRLAKSYEERLHRHPNTLAINYWQNHPLSGWQGKCQET